SADGLLQSGNDCERCAAVRLARAAGGCDQVGVELYVGEPAISRQPSAIRKRHWSLVVGRWPRPKPASGKQRRTSYVARRTRGCRRSPAAGRRRRPTREIRKQSRTSHVARRTGGSRRSSAAGRRRRPTREIRKQSRTSSVAHRTRSGGFFATNEF